MDADSGCGVTFGVPLDAGYSGFCLEMGRVGQDLLLYQRHHASRIKADLPGTCYVCKLIIKKVKAKLNGDNNKDDTAAALDSICGSLRMLKGMCKKLVNKYKVKLIDALVGDVDARDACKTLKLCK
ncbi:unnamed protein product [Coregonus sp. 'balchen']|nr:unnamed protein product [Coregonus sp. 'balchen']